MLPNLEHMYLHAVDGKALKILLAANDEFAWKLGLVAVSVVQIFSE